MNIDLHVEEAGNQLIIDRPKFTVAAIRRISRQIRENVALSSGIPTIADDVVLKIRTALIVADNSQSPQTINLWDCYNHMNKLLTLSCQFKSSYIRTPSQTERYLLVHANKVNMKHIELLDMLAQYLLSLPMPRTNDRAAREIHYACTYVTATAIFAKVLFPNYHEFLLTLTNGQVFHRPSYLIKPTEGSNAIKRYFLPFPANVLLNRLLLYCHNQYQLSRPSDMGAPAFQFSAFTLKTFPSVYRQWLIETLNIYPSEAMNLLELRRAVIASSVLENSNSGIGPYPTFVITALSDGISSYSFGNDTLSNLINGYAPPRKDYVQKVEKGSFVEFQNIALHSALREITTIRRSLEKTDKWKSKRKEAADAILDVVHVYSERLERHDHENLELSAKWINSMIHNCKKPSSMNTNASLIWLFLSDLSNMHKRVYELDHDDYIYLLRQAAERYSSTKIIKVLLSFLSFVSVEKENSFEIPDLFLMTRKLKLGIKDLPSLQQFVDFDVTRDVSSVLISQITSVKNSYSSLLTVNKSEHLALTRRHAAQLTFHTGLRIDELINLRVTDILEDDGPTLFVRKSKTNNGKRYLPLSILLPDSYLAEFMSYIKYRKSLPCKSNYLFINSAFHRFDDKSLTEALASIFEEVGIRDFHFHLLRHASANWILILWFVAFFGDEISIPSDTPFLLHEIFSRDHINKFKKLFLGLGAPKKGQESFTYVLPVLARILGHGGPIISLHDYIHVIDWLFYLLSLHYATKEASLFSQQVSDLLQQSVNSLPPELRGRGMKNISVDVLLDFQQNWLGIE